MAGNFLVLAPAPLGRQGVLVTVAGQHGVDLHFVDCGRQVAPDYTAFDALVVLATAGGGGRFFPSPNKEKGLVRAWLNLGRPCLCIGPGHLLLAGILGAKIGMNFTPSKGVTTGHLTHDGRQHPLFHGIPTTISLFKWHRHAVQTPLPRSILLLATSSECMVEAFCMRGRPEVIGLQFENYLGHPQDLQARIGPGDETAIRNDLVQARALQRDFEVMMKNFITMVG